MAGLTEQPPGRGPWWHSRPLLQRYLRDLLAAELAALRPGQARMDPLAWSDALQIDHDLGADSLELTGLATSLVQATHLHESGIEDYLLARRSFGQWTDIASAGLDLFSARLAFRTSGSTGVAKSCTHALDALQQEIACHAGLLAGRRRIVVAVPAHHIYGFLFTVLLPHALGLGAADVVDVRASAPASLVRRLRPGDVVIGFPDFWRAVTQTAESFPADVWGVTSTAPCPDGVCADLAAAGLARLFQIYGSSETAGIGWRDDYRAPYQLLPFWSFAADAGDAGNHGPMLRRTLPGGDHQTLPVQDQLERTDERRFMVGPRTDQAVQVGGINVFPAHVAAVLREHPGVQDAAVRLMRPHEGLRLKAFIVPAAGVGDTQQLAEDLNRWMDQRLTVPQRPRALRFGDRLPTTPEGKAADWPVLGD